MSASLPTNRKPTFTEDHLLAVLSHQIAWFGGQKAWARHYGVSPKWLNNVLCGRAQMSPGIALKLGYRKVMRFERIDGPRGRRWLVRRPGQ